MRIRSLRLKNYGLFSDETVDFGPGATVVLGPNEAGKSTLLDALDEFLWGIRNQSPRAIRFKPKYLELQGVVEVNGGSATTYIRQLKHLRDTAGDDVTPPWDPALARDTDGWKSMFGLNLTRLQEGGRQVIAGGGDLADLIFLAETGKKIREVRDELATQMHAIFKERKSSPCDVRASLSRIRKLDETLATSEASATDVLNLRQKISQGQLRRDESAAGRLEVDREGRRVAELLRCLPYAEELRDLKAELQEIQASGRVLPAPTASELAQALSDRAAALTKIEDLESDIHEQGNRLAQLSLSPELIDAQEAIKQLQEALEARRQDRALVEDEAGLEADRSEVVKQLRALGVNPSTDLEADVHRACLAEATRARLTRIAQQTVEAQKSFDDESERLKKMGEEAVADAQGPADSQLMDARSQRDTAWQAIREPWLSGDLPTSSTRHDMARELDEALVYVDKTAEQMSDQLVQAAQVRGAAEQNERHLQEARRDLDEKREALDALKADWTEVAEQCGLPPGVDAVAWSVHADHIQKLQEAWNVLESSHAARSAARSRWDSFCAKVGELQSLPASEPADPLLRVDALVTALSDARRAEASADEIEPRLQQWRQDLEQSRDLLGKAEATIDQIVAGSEESADDLVQRSERAREKESEVDAKMTQLKSAKEPGTELESLLEALGETDQSELEAREETTASEKDRLDLEITDLDGQLAVYRKDLEGLETRDSAADVRAGQVAEGEKLRSLVEKYRGLRLQVELLDAFGVELAKSADSPVLDDAAGYLTTLTSGRYVGFKVIEEGEERHIEMRLADPSGESLLDLKELSLGTADQVFLALRLAGIRAKQQERVRAGLPTLPVVLDDVLVAHDDVRSNAALQVISELATDMQVILMTHHESVSEAAASIQGVTIMKLALPESAA